MNLKEALEYLDKPFVVHYEEQINVLILKLMAARGEKTWADRMKHLRRTNKLLSLLISHCEEYGCEGEVAPLDEPLKTDEPRKEGYA